MKPLRVLVACEMSGVVREACNAYSGVDAVSCDLLPPEDGRIDYHQQCDVRDIISEPWDLMIVTGREARIHKMPPSADRGKLRSITYAGIAQAMADQWLAAALSPSPATNAETK